MSEDEDEGKIDITAISGAKADETETRARLYYSETCVARKWRTIVISGILRQDYTEHEFKDLAKLAGVPQVK